MKKQRIVVLVLLLSTILFSSLQAQIQVKADGGVRIGTAPGSALGQPSWQLTAKGLEANIGDVKLHTAGGGYMLLSGSSQMPTNTALSGPGLGGSIVVPSIQTYLTGLALTLGTTENAIWHIRTNLFIP